MCVTKEKNVQNGKIDGNFKRKWKRDLSSMMTIWIV
jgi:hypothetical protein